VSFWGRGRDIALLVAAVVLQLILVGYQVRRDDDMTLLRAWTVGAVTPVNKTLHGGFSFVSNFWSNYVWLVDARGENQHMQDELDRLRMENDQLQRRLEQTARRRDLDAYQKRSPSNSLMAEVIGGGAGSNAREILLDKGRRDGVLPGMPVVTADGIVGKVEASYPSSSLVLLVNDSDSGAGAVLGDSRVRGVLKGRGGKECLLDYVAPEVKVREGETIYTSGDDRVYPKGLRIGSVVRLEEGVDFQQIWVEPFARLDRLDDVLVLTSPTHEPLPEPRRPQLPSSLLPLPSLDDPPAPNATAPTADPKLTDADRIVERYRAIADAQDIELGRTNPSGRTPDFNRGAAPPNEALGSSGPASSVLQSAPPPAPGAGQGVQP